ncbi:hypothetical protein ACFVU3_14235 [Streptomyces sp. NPDC058052]|uniref:hypothetical protein n=1 Tax=Streptomyces sp. NPDC058052 TaxID=3346316 RepID=UPI0036E3AB73
MAVAIVAVLGGLLSAYYANYLLDRTTADDRARTERKAATTADREQPAFVATFTPRDIEQDPPENFIVLLDRKLTADEQAGLTATDAGGDGLDVWRFLKPLGGRLLEYAEPQAFPNDGLEDGRYTPDWRWSQSFNLNLNSDRIAGLTINSMTAVKDSCRPSNAQTVVDLPPAGAEGRQGLMWDLTGGAKGRTFGPYVLDEGEDQGKLFFRHHVIELGNGQSNMAMHIQPRVSDQTCTWHIDASYTDTSGTHTRRIPDGTESFTTESVPQKPAQYFQHVIGEGWGCTGQVIRKNCPAAEWVEKLPPEWLGQTSE